LKYIAEPLSRGQLRRIALQIRKLIGYEDILHFPVVYFLEIILPLLSSGFYCEIVPKSELGYGKHGDTDVVNRCIRIREDVYYGALNGCGRDIMTIAHEISHYILLVIGGVKFARTFDGTLTPTYRDPEWQAKALAGELMCPAHLIVGLTPAQIARECGVSLAAAEYQLKKAGGDVPYISK